MVQKAKKINSENKFAFKGKKSMLAGSTHAFVVLKSV